MEHADRLAEFLQLNESEKQYLFILIEFERAGTHNLKKYWKNELHKLQKDHLSLKNRFSTKNTINQEVQAIYFSAWFYSAIHLLLTSNRQIFFAEISEKLGPPLYLVSETIHWLEQNGFGYIENSRWTGNAVNFHLPSDSYLIKKHHTHWRIKALQSIELNKTDELHYSTCFTLSQNDWSKIKEILINCIELTKQTIKASGDEKLYSIGVDFFCLETQ